MAERQIQCWICDKDLGVIRDATLRVNISHSCDACTATVKLLMDAGAIQNNDVMGIFDDFISRKKSKF